MSQVFGRRATNTTGRLTFFHIASVKTSSRCVYVPALDEHDVFPKLDFRASAPAASVRRRFSFRPVKSVRSPTRRVVAVVRPLPVVPSREQIFGRPFGVGLVFFSSFVTAI